MTLYYTLVFVILVAEMASFLFLVTPLPRRIRKTVLTVLTDSPLASQAIITLRFTFLFILILFIDSVNRVYRVQATANEAFSSGRIVSNMISVERSEIQASKFYAQRNMYLCGFTLFLSLILNRTYHLVLDLMNAKETIASIKGTSNDAVKSDLVKSESKAEIDRLEKLVAQKDRDLETLKKQSAALTKEYNSVSDKLNAQTGHVDADKKRD